MKEEKECHRDFLFDGSSDLSSVSAETEAGSIDIDGKPEADLESSFHLASEQSVSFSWYFNKGMDRVEMLARAKEAEMALLRIEDTARWLRGKIAAWVAA